MRECGVSAVFGLSGFEEGGSGRQMMKVSLSRSSRHDFCIEYSSGRERGSEAVRDWISCSGGGLVCWLIFDILVAVVEQLVGRMREGGREEGGK